MTEKWCNGACKSARKSLTSQKKKGGGGGHGRQSLKAWFSVMNIDDDDPEDGWHSNEDTKHPF